MKQQPLSGAPVHVCGGPECCASHEDFLKKAEAVVAECIVAPLPPPALNKWTRLGPTIARVTLMSHFCGLLKHAMREEFGALAERVQDEESEDEQGQAVGLPLDERAAWKRVADKRRVKSVEFVADKDASWGNLTWLTIASPILVLHWKLFKHAKWASEVDPRKERPGRIMKQFCVPKLNPAADVIDDLLELLRAPNQRLGCVFFFHGPLAQWLPARKRALQQLVLLSAGQLWRKLVLPWQLYPWRLWPLVWGESSEERERAAELLLAERDCCLDDVFTRKLQRLALDAASLTSAEMREFLTACFTRLVATSTFVERRFASYGAWSARRASACRLPMLAAKHVTSCVKEFVEHWRQREQVEKPKGAKSRPEWQVSAQKGLRQTGLHVFAQEQRQIMEGQWGAGAAACASFLATARSRWAKLSSAEKGKYSQLARERNAHSRALAMASQDREQKTGGPWDVASLRGRWPLDEDVLKSALAAAPFQNLAESWKADHSAVEADVLNVTEPGEHAIRLFAGCHPGLCQADLTVQQERARARYARSCGRNTRRPTDWVPESSCCVSSQHRSRKP